MCLKYVLRTERLVRPVLALDKDRSGLQALGVVPLADRDAESHAVGSGEAMAYAPVMPFTPSMKLMMLEAPLQCLTTTYYRCICQNLQQVDNFPYYEHFE